MPPVQGEIYLASQFNPFVEVTLSPTETTVVGRKTLSAMGVRSAEFPKKMCISRSHAVFSPNGKDTFTLKCKGQNPLHVVISAEKRVLYEGESAVVTCGDRISLLHNWFMFSIEKMGSEERSLGSKRKLEPRMDFSRNEKRASAKKSGRRGGEVVIGKPVKLWDHTKQMWLKGLVLQITDNEESGQKQALVDLEGEQVWKAVTDLIVENTMMLIKETDIIKSMTDQEHKSKRQRRVGTATDRITRSKRPVFYNEWESSSEDEGEIAAAMLDEAEGKYNSRYADREPTQISPDQVSSEVTAIFYNKACEYHFVPKWHYEKPERLSTILKGLEHLVKKYPNTVKIIEDFPPLTDQDLMLAHTETYLKRVVQMVPNTDIPTHITQYSEHPDDTRDPEEDFDTFMSKSSWQAILTATGAVRRAIDMVHSREVRNSFCAIRPPGHHCGASGHTNGANSQGYCIVNNVVLGALYAKQKYNYEKIAVVDFDVHHGNGTEEILANREGFMFASIHASDIYPHTGGNHVSRSHNVTNVALEVGDGSDEFHKAFDAKIIPALIHYAPDLLIISAGFDAHKKDPTDGLNLEEQDYFIMTEKLKNIASLYCGGRIVSVLEGGYHLPSLKRSVREHVLSLIKK